MTDQIPDRMRLENSWYHLRQSLPLLPQGDPRREQLSFVSECTANARGYTASWAISRGRLFLTSFGGTIRADGVDGARTRVSMADVHEVEEPVPAGWISGHLRCESLELAHQRSGRGVPYRVRLLRIERGRVAEDESLESTPAASEISFRDEPVRCEINQGLRVGPHAYDPAAAPVPLLAEALARESNVSAPQLSALLWQAGRADLDVLIAALSSRTEPNLRRWIAYALARIGADAAPAIPVLLEVLHRTVDPDLLKALAYGLAGIGSPAAPHLKTIIEVTEGRCGSTAAGQIDFLIDQLGPSEPELTEPLIEGLLATKSPATRYRIAYLLGEVGPAALQPLVRGLNAARSDVERMAVAEALEKVGQQAKSSLGALFEALNRTEDDAARASIADAIRAIGLRTTVSLAPLREEFRSAREAGALLSLSAAMASLGAEAVPALVQELTTARSDIARRALARALGEIGGPAASAAGCLAASAEATKDQELTIELADALRKVGAPPEVTATAQIAALRAARSGYHRDSILKQIVSGVVPSALAIENLAALLANEGRGASGPQMAKLLGAIGAPAVEALYLVLRSAPPGEGRLLIIHALGVIGAPAKIAIDSVVAALTSAEDDASRLRIVDSLHQIGTPAIAHLDDLLGIFDSSAFRPLRWRLGLVLASIGEPAVIPLLERLGRAADDDTRRAIGNALGHIGAPAAFAGPALLNAMHASLDPHTRDTLAKALRRLGVRLA